MTSIRDVTGRESFKVAVILGSGLSEVARSLAPEGPVGFGSLDGLHSVSVEGHEGALYWGDVESVPTLVFAGRVHLYEGFTAKEVAAPVELAAAAGCETIVLTNASGAINPAIDVGAPCLISDHLNLTGENPQRGPHDSRGPRFLDLTEVYDTELRALAHEVDPALKDGVYAGLAGPTYETPAEIRMLSMLGADLVGMSTVLEAIQARYLDMKVLGVSVATNVAAGLASEPLHHDEVAAAGRAASKRLEDLLRGVLGKL